MRRILVIRGGAIGDFVLTLPAIGALRAAFPKARLEILGYRHIIALAENRFYADAVRSIEYSAFAPFFGRGTELAAELADHFASFDLVVSYLFDPDGHFETNLRRCGVEEILRGPFKIAAGEHAALQLAQPLRELGLTMPDGAARLYPSTADRAVADRILNECRRPLLAVHPGSGSETKNWPIEHWIEITERLGGEATLVVVGGEADTTRLAVLRSLLGERRAIFVENLPLPHLAAVLAGCSCFIGHDSGISHIAAATGVPSLLLFGPTDPAIWAPRNANAHILRAPDGDLAKLSVSEVAQELMRIGIST